MGQLDGAEVQRLIHPDTRLLMQQIEVFPEIESTNSYLMQEAAPDVGRFRVAATDNQTAGRGRQGRQWLSPPGSGICLSFAYTFARYPEDLSALTLAVGIGVVDALMDFDIVGVSLKWPNDLVFKDAKLGGILTEVNHRGQATLTVVTGVGINIDLPETLELAEDSEWAGRAVGLRTATPLVPDRDVLVARIVDSLARTVSEFELQGFEAFLYRWQALDWLYGKDIVVERPSQPLRGRAVSVDRHGALQVEVPGRCTEAVATGSIRLAADEGEPA